MKVDSITYNSERKSNTYYSNTKKRDQRSGEFSEVFMQALHNVSRYRRQFS